MQQPVWRNWIKRIASALLALLLMLMFLRWFEHAQVYFPDKRLVTDASALGRPAKDVSFEAGDGTRLNGWFFPANSASPRSQFVILQSHGNAGNISHRLDHFAAILETGASLLAYDYRGYGRSEGRPGEAGTYLDAQAAYAWLRQKGFAATNIVLLGESLGGGIASELATREPIGGLILQSTFTSIPDIGAELFPWLPVRRLASIRYDTLSKLGRIQAPLLVLHGREDEIIGFHHGERLFAAAREPKLFLELQGGHNNWLEAGRENYIAALNRFLSMIESPQAQSPDGKTR